jgi:hypothetical protein
MAVLPTLLLLVLLLIAVSHVNTSVVDAIGNICDCVAKVFVSIAVSVPASVILAAVFASTPRYFFWQALPQTSVLISCFSSSAPFLPWL